MITPSSLRCSSGSKTLDEMLCGGFLKGSANLLEGAAGTGKSTLGTQFLMEGMKRGEAGLIITFEEFPEQYYQCSLELGWDLKAMEEKGLLEIIFTTPEEFLSLIHEENGNESLSKLIEEKNIQRAVLDSITNLEKLAGSQGELREIETDVVNYFKREDITTLLLKENRNILGGLNLAGNKIPFIVDSYLVLRYIELKSSIKRGIMILKMRGSDHAKTIREYEISSGGIRIGESFSGVQGIFAGTGIQTLG